MNIGYKQSGDMQVPKAGIPEAAKLLPQKSYVND